MAIYEKNNINIYIEKRKSSKSVISYPVQTFNLKKKNKKKKFKLK
jgi:hypothetical protein